MKIGWVRLAARCGDRTDATEGDHNSRERRSRAIGSAPGHLSSEADRGWGDCRSHCVSCEGEELN